MTESSQAKAARILIVEDEAAIRTLISFACAAAGFEVNAQKTQSKRKQSLMKRRPISFCLTICCQNSQASIGFKDFTPIPKQSTCL